MSDATPPTLLEWLYAQYEAALRKQSVSDDILATQAAYLQPFRDWVEFFLGQVRPVFIAHGQESNYVITLAGNGVSQQVLVCPPLQAGSMAKSGQVVSMSSPASRGGPQGVVNTEYIQVGGDVVEARPEPFAGYQQTSDLTQSEGLLDMTRPDAQWPKLY